MSNKTIIWIVIVILVLGGGYFLISQSQNHAPAQTSETIPLSTPVQTPAPSSATPQPVTYSVNIQNFSFSPSQITVNKGDKIIWKNNDSAPHTVTGDGGLNSGTLSPGGNYSFTFNASGTFEYHCSFHPSMVAAIIVK